MDMVLKLDRTSSKKTKILGIVILSIWLISEFLRSEQSAEPTNEETYVSPPSYEVLGRGLVYNCKGKHWACVNQEAYFACRNNMNWNSKNRKPHECYTFNVYASDEDCEVIQRYNINTLAKTDFCNQ
ncbi:MAG: hypothetical protein A2X86_06155 [Bdellovibrionales bacterium GWA2_49_15]|nr:MAG: hypothetical protein A2X86_06155 [Bdellovibrionales bacterium GWA2_49_15]HAZ14645.1 hypothetical protein [Bdellovibrionales bacterium]